VCDIIGKENFAEISDIKLSATAFPLARFLANSFTLKTREEIVASLKIKVDWNEELKKLKRLQQVNH